MPPQTSDLKITVQEPEAWSRRLTITVPADRVERVRGAVTKQIRSSARLPGFRKGKLPESVIEQRFGPSIRQETLDRSIQEAYREALDTEGLTPINQGRIEQIQWEPGEDLTFEVELEIRPEVEIARSTGFTVQRPSYEVGEEDVESVIERLRDDRATWTPMEKDAHPDFGDRVTVEITALEGEGSAEEGAEPRTYRFVIGEGQAIPDVEDAIRTLSPEEEGEFTVTFPEDFPEEDRRGEQQRLRIRLSEASRKELPEVDDEFAKSVGEFETVEALKERIRADLQEDSEQRTEAEVRQQLIDRIIEANPFTLPSSMVNRYVDYMTGAAEREGRRRESTPEQAERIAQLREGLKPQAEWSLKRSMIVDRLAEQEGLQATQDEIDARIEDLAKTHERSPSEVWLELEKSGQLEALEREITEEKVFRHLLDQNQVA